VHSVLWKKLSCSRQVKRPRFAGGGKSENGWRRTVEAVSKFVGQVHAHGLSLSEAGDRKLEALGERVCA
jgi:hypothetical protein